MTKDINNYLHLYLGCDCMWAIIVPGQEPTFEKCQLKIRELHGAVNNLALCKPILRRLSSMTEDEAVELYDFLYPSSTAERKIKRFAITNHLDDKGVYWEGKIAIFDYIDWFPWLLKKGFDLFGLIDEGLGIDAATIKTND